MHCRHMNINQVFHKYSYLQEPVTSDEIGWILAQVRYVLWYLAWELHLSGSYRRQESELPVLILSLSLLPLKIALT